MGFQRLMLRRINIKHLCLSPVKGLKCPWNCSDLSPSMTTLFCGPDGLIHRKCNTLLLLTAHHIWDGGPGCLGAWSSRHRSVTFPLHSPAPPSPPRASGAPDSFPHLSTIFSMVLAGNEEAGTRVLAALQVLNLSSAELLGSNRVKLLTRKPPKNLGNRTGSKPKQTTFI